MTRRLIVVVLATAALALLLAVAAPRAEAVSFVDKQVQAGALLIQNYINTYGQAHQFVYPPKTMVKKGGGLPNATLIWPSNPWTGKIMGSGHLARHVHVHARRRRPELQVRSSTSPAASSSSRAGSRRG